MKTNAKKKLATVRTRRTLVQLLKKHGPMDATALAERLAISAMAVRQHLYALQDERLVTFQEESRPMGRPATPWQLTPAADRLFPEAYAELTLNLMSSVSAAFGKEGLERLLALRTQQQIETYCQPIGKGDTLQQRLAKLAAIRTDEGYNDRRTPPSRWVVSLH